MGFIQTIKSKLGIGGVKIALHVPGQVAKSEGIIKGKIVLTSKSPQELISMKVVLKEKYTTGRGEDKKTKEFILGEYKTSLLYSINPGDEKELHFDLKFALVKSNSDDLKEMGGAMGKLGSMAAFANNEKSEYEVEAMVDVKSAALDPSDSKAIKLI
ncbi:MAG: hypothetical protein K0S33_924 [Bacteroidetes bacterium]|jgi:hypothetical protein|nr:hypothetical protein [Bacteroidota bacterium]